MPVRLTVNETSLSGSSYDDVIGVRYEFPSRYQRIIQPGRRFVYYRGRRTRTGGSQPPAYLGVGVIGNVSASAQADGLYLCDIDDYVAFGEPVYFKDSDGKYYEPGASGGFYWQTGVKEIPESAYERIIAASGDLSAATTDNAASDGRQGYASPQHAAAVDDFAMRFAMHELSQIWSDDEIVRQPHNNPGFDVRVGPANEVVRFVEVKGTTLPRPTFFLSEGERRFSVTNAERYTLIVIYSIDLADERYQVHRHDGSIGPDAFTLSVRQWQCEVLPSLP